MKCPYRDFQECLVEQCPSCNYTVVESYVTAGICPAWMDRKVAMEQGFIWEEIRKDYKFVSCKLVDNCVQPVPATKQVVNNTTTKTNVVVRKSIF